jgi:hypothetical protein
MAKLPKFIYDKVISNKTTLGDNPCVPKTEEYDEFPYLYSLLKERYDEVSSNFYSDNIEEIENELQIIITETIKEESKVRPQLQMLCENIITDIFLIPKDAVDFDCELVDKLENTMKISLTPESSKKLHYEFDNVNDIKNSNKEVLKRRFINSLIQGASYLLSDISNYYDDIIDISPKLYDNYIRIRELSDYILFNKEMSCSDCQKNQGAFVNVIISKNDIQPKIISRGVIFPYLLNESIRGFMEVFASHGLPSDAKKAKLVMKQADFLMAEPFDLRIGVNLWKNFFPYEIQYNSRVIPYYFSTICKMKAIKFNNVVREMLSETKRGKSIAKNIFIKSIHDMEYDKFYLDMLQRSDDGYVINEKSTYK